MSNLLEYAKHEMKSAGLYDEGTDYGPGQIAQCVEKMIEAFSSYNHSGGSAEMTLAIFDRLVRFKPLTDITNDPDEWMEVADKMWQNRRDGECFSTDGGKTYYSLKFGKDKVFVSVEK